MCRTRSPGSWRGSPVRASGSIECSTRSPRGCGSCRCSCTRTCPSRRGGCSRHSVSTTCPTTGRRSGPGRIAECVERRYLCPFAGNVTYPKAAELQTAARELPEELLLVETDSPYLSPQPVRGKPNEPANVVATAQFVAELRGVSYEELDAAVERNAARVFGDW